MPLALDQKIGTVIWSRLTEGRLSGKHRHYQPLPQNTRTSPKQPGISYLDEVSEETGKTVALISLNSLLQRPSISRVVIGARNEEQLSQNLGGTDWSLDTDQLKKLDTYLI